MRGQSPTAPPAVRLIGISRRFGSVIANDNVDLEVAAGEVHALLGENGAGKTTLMNILVGLYRADAGQIELHGKPVQIHSPRDAKRARLGMVHQEQRLVSRFTAPENISLGHREPRFFTPPRYFRQLASRLSTRYGLPIDAQHPIWELPLGRRQRVELIKLLHHGAELIVLDEPTTNLTPAEVETFFQAVRQLTAAGRTVILITHKLDEVLRYSDRLTVMRAGRAVATLPTATANRDAVNRLMMGQDQPPPAPARVSWPRQPQPAATDVGVPVLTLDRLSTSADQAGEALRDLSLEVRAGEVLAIAGVAGNGQTALAEAITGGLTHYAGRISIAGHDIRALNRRQVTALGLAYVAENRREVGLALDQGVAVNLALRVYNQPPFSRAGWLDRRVIRAEAERLIARYQIQTPSPDTAVGRLSGGNQQRVIVARELSGQPRLIVVDNFTRGLDPASTERCINDLLAHRDRGAAVVWITSDLSDALRCDRIAVLQRGRLTGLLPGATANRESLGLLMTGNEVASP